MATIPSAKPSPRIENGIIYWYVGDTFDIEFVLNLEDQDKEPIIIQPTDTVTLKFKDNAEVIVKEFEFEDVENNTVTCSFDDAVSSLFPIGKYRYDVYLNGQKRTTVANENRVVVE